MTNHAARARFSLQFRAPSRPRPHHSANHRLSIFCAVFIIHHHLANRRGDLQLKNGLSLRIWPLALKASTTQTHKKTSPELRSYCKVANTPSTVISPTAPRTQTRALLPSVRAHERRADGAGGASSAAKETAQLRGAAFEWSPLPPPVARGEWSRPRVFSRAAREDLGEICWVRRELGEQREAIGVERRRRVVRREQAELAEKCGGGGCAAAKNHHHDHFITQVWAAW